MLRIAGRKDLKTDMGLQLAAAPGSPFCHSSALVAMQTVTKAQQTMARAVSNCDQGSANHDQGLANCLWPKSSCVPVVNKLSPELSPFPGCLLFAVTELGGCLETILPCKAENFSHLSLARNQHSLHTCALDEHSRPIVILFSSYQREPSEAIL